MAPVVLAADTLNGRIGDFAGLVGLVLVLVTLFTSQREGALQELGGEVPDTPAPYTRELWIDAALAIVTLLLFLCGLPLIVDALKTLHPLRSGGQLPAAFVIVWLLLIALLAWQARLFLAVRGARRRWMTNNGWRSPAHWWQPWQPPSDPGR